MTASKPPLIHLGLVGDGDDEDLLVFVERQFGIKFETNEGHSWHKVGDLYDAVTSKLEARGQSTEDVWPKLCMIIGNEIGAFPSRITKDTPFFETEKPVSWTRRLIEIVLVLTVLAVIGILAAPR